MNVMIKYNAKFLVTTVMVVMASVYWALAMCLSFTWIILQIPPSYTSTLIIL